MSGAKETPRQKMIGMLYLVLLAMLALNVSKSILNSFVVVNNALVTTNDNFKTKTQMTYDAFARAMANDAKKTGPSFNLAMRAKGMSDSLYNEIRDIKATLFMACDKKLTKAEADTIKLGEIEAIDNYDEPTRLLIGSDAGNPITTPGSAKYLKEKLIQYRKDMIALLPVADRTSINIGLEFPDVYSKSDGTQSWEANAFYHSTLAAATTLLTKEQNDVRNAEAAVTNDLLGSITANDFKFDVLQAKVIAPTNYVMLGDTFKADVFLAAFSSTQNPKIVLGDTAMVNGVPTIKGPVDSNTIGPKKVIGGIGKYEVKTTTVGIQDWSGLIKIKAPNGSYKSYPFSGEYLVAKPSLVVSPTKMNVFYIGVDNPVDVSVPGVAADDLIPHISGGSIRPDPKQKGSYIVRVTGGLIATITASAKTKVGGKEVDKTIPGSLKFRIKTIPDPIAQVDGKEGDDVIPAGLLRITPGVRADLKDFDFDVKFIVTSFDVSIAVHGIVVTQSSSSQAITAAQTALLKNASKGSKVYFENVKARGPDGKTRKIPGVNFKVI